MEDRYLKRFATFLGVLGAAGLLAAALAGCGTSGKREGRIEPPPPVTVQTGDPVLAAAPGYVGSRACAVCHPGDFEGWGRSLHNVPLKTVAELGDGIFVNDADGNGVNDFRDGLDLSSNPNFSAFGANAPKLSASGGKHFLTIGAVAYEVQRTQGGNGYWKQRYHTRIGRSYYILPVQYNEKTREYVLYDASNWYDGANLPRYTAAYGTDALVAQFGIAGASGALGTQVSFENRCAGCHQTGLVVKAETTAYGAATAEEAVTGYVELNIGCERCHGPGAAHAASGDPADILNPDNFLLLGPAGVRAANQVCGSCHSRGEGNATILSGTDPLPLQYPAKFAASVLQLPLPGDSLVDNSAGNPFVLLDTGDAYYGVPPPAIFSRYGGWYSGYDFPTYVASRRNHQYWTDLEQGPHSADRSGGTCWSCHDAHKAAGNPDADPGDDHMIRGTITQAGVTLPTRDDDNSLCMACHAGDFGLTESDVKAGGPSVATAVLAHMGTEAVMGTVVYDPAGSGVGRCSGCHMPRTASSAVRTPFGNGLGEGDIHNHTFNVVWPSANLRLKVAGSSDPAEMANSCYAAACHDNDPASAHYVSEITEWSGSGHADFTGEPFRHWDGDGTVSRSCAKCHSKPGFRDFAIDGSNAAAKLGTTISCGACHTEEGDGTTLWDRRATYTALSPVLFPSGLTADMGDASNLCMACHQGRASKQTVDDRIANSDFRFVNIHYFAAAATLFGTDVQGGYEYDANSNIGARSYVGRFLHASPLRDTCIRCHMGKSSDLLENNHTFEPRTAYCQLCHFNAVTNPTDPAHPFRDIRFSAQVGGTYGIDFDGDGNATEGLYYEIWDTLVPNLLAQIQAYASGTIGTPIAYDPDTHPYFFRSDDGTGYDQFDSALLKAAYNYQVVQKDPCGYVHNGQYIIQLLRDSIEDLSGNEPPGVRP